MFVLSVYQLGSSGLAFLAAFNSPLVLTMVSPSALFAFVSGLLMLLIALILGQTSE